VPAHIKTGDDKSSCPLCSSTETYFYFKDNVRTYTQCAKCALVFVQARYWLNADDEKATYDLHENDPNDAGYRKFLSRLSAPLLEHLPPHRSGLDFGCGPGPALSQIFKEQGHTVDLYDPFYFDNPAVFDKIYDFICATEVVEHLRQPAQEMVSLFKLLRPGGWLGIMTKLVSDKEAFSHWHYIRDLTHICFFSRATFEYIAKRFGANITFIGNDVILLRQKPAK
jgi:SAM-dependent methyltransferase